MTKKRVVIGILAAISFLCLAFIIISILNTQNKESQKDLNPTSKLPISFNEIVPGETTKQDVTSKMGEPLKDLTATDSGTLYYKSSVTTLNNHIIIRDGTVALIKEIVSFKDTKKVSDIVKIYGLSQYSLFGADSVGGSKLYIYPDKGIAYIGKPKFDTLSEIWYFSPTTIEDFRARWAQNYSETRDYGF